MLTGTAPDRYEANRKGRVHSFSQSLAISFWCSLYFDKAKMWLASDSNIQKDKVKLDRVMNFLSIKKT